MSNSVVPELLCYLWEPPVLQDEQVLEGDNGDGCPAVQVYSMPLNCTLKNG